MKVQFRKSFEKDISKIRDGDLLARRQSVIEEFENAKSLLDISNIKKLKAQGDYHRIRVGNYRIGIADNKDVITFVRVLHRQEMYRYFP